jgi:hypothetical protein
LMTYVPISAPRERVRTPAWWIGVSGNVGWRFQ